MQARLLLDAIVTPKLANVLQKTPLAGPLGLTGDLADPVGQTLADLDTKPLNPTTPLSTSSAPARIGTGTMTVTLPSGKTVARVTLASGNTVDVPVDPAPTLTRDTQMESAALTEAR